MKAFRYFIFVGWLFLVGITSGCVSSFLKIDQAHYQMKHDTSLIIVNCSPIGYYWAGPGDRGGTIWSLITRESARTVGLVYRGSAEEEIGKVEPYLNMLKDPTSLISTVYYQTFKRTLGEQGFIQLHPLTDTTKYCGSKITLKKAQKGLLLDGINLPSEEHPDWLLVLYIRTIGLVNHSFWGGGLLGYAMTSAMPKLWTADFLADVWLVDANTRKVVWTGQIPHRHETWLSSVELGKDLDKLVAIDSNEFPDALIKAISEKAVRDALSIKYNVPIYEISVNHDLYMLDPMERRGLMNYLKGQATKGSHLD